MLEKLILVVGGGIPLGVFNTVSGGEPVDVDGFLDAVAKSCRIPHRFLEPVVPATPELRTILERQDSYLNRLMKLCFHQFEVSLLNVIREDDRKEAYTIRKLNRRLQKMNFGSKVVRGRDVKITLKSFGAGLGIDMEATAKPFSPLPFHNSRRGIVTFTYIAVQNRCLQKLREVNFDVISVTDFPELEMIQVEGTHPYMRELTSGDVLPFYLGFLDVRIMDDFYRYLTKFKEVSDPTVLNEIPLKKTVELINMMLQGVDPDSPRDENDGWVVETYLADKQK